MMMKTVPRVKCVSGARASHVNAKKPRAEPIWPRTQQNVTTLSDVGEYSAVTSVYSMRPSRSAACPVRRSSRTASIIAHVVNRLINPMLTATRVPRTRPHARIAGGSAKMPVPTTALKSAAAAAMCEVPSFRRSDEALSRSASPAPT